MSKPSSGQVLGNNLDDKSSSMMQSLRSMGFDSSSNCLRAIQQSGGNLDVAIDMLLNNTGGANESGNTASMGNEGKSRRIVQCPISQYDIPQGKSACTCIALRAAQQFLVASTSASGNDDPYTSGLISPDFLQRILLEGVDLYKSLQSNATDTSVEHMSAEEVLGRPSTNSLRLSTIGGVRQGILGREGLSLFSVLKECHVRTNDGEHGSSSNNWVAVVLTKTPETVVVLLPPMTSSNNSGAMENNDSKHSFILIDSHPRPGISLNCYAAFHSSLEDLVKESLEQIFPVNNSLDPNDVGEMMVMMYNSFDAYPLRLKTE
mmetsp:Transcript_38435/g.44786  ORF Transcript_38435/g.44786 Transcript_38435/m.44786 type:complete len:319 (+) Transcript_38435:79-1035(+)|eukprot:CAMPEP_0194357884 /NCGR_PEP_ID=MMETSP0174-20130528/5298_1 /TAXON_ID=216777 /ORGANISM="Proboscia alata, Strain PI-D3" /LENGTH=318 /DNA_ID=CAMNT_0039128081 /DNA_START=79 /DNA_END=1035 /DNA_ORIENTATION=+